MPNLLILLLLLLPKLSSAGDTLIVSGHPNYPPFMWQQGQEITGACSTFVSEILESLSIPFTNKETGPWARVQYNAKVGKIDMIMCAYENVERKEYMHYSDPIYLDPVVLFVKKGKSFPYKVWSDLIGYHGSTNRGESYGEQFDQYIKQHLSIQRVNHSRQNLELLNLERTDFFLFGQYPGLAEAKITGYQDKIEFISTPVTSEYFHLTISKKSKFKNLMPKINRKINELYNEEKMQLQLSAALQQYQDYNSSQSIPKVIEF